MTALVFLGGAVIAILGLRAQAKDVVPLQDRLALAFIAFVGVVGVLDEMSFGERLFNLPPLILAGVKVDGAHDLIDVFNTLRRDAFGPLPGAAKGAIMLAGVGVLAGGAYLVHRWRALIFNPKARSLSLPMIILGALLFAELALSTLIDLTTIAFPGADIAVEEVAELNAAVATAGLAYVLGWAAAKPSA